MTTYSLKKNGIIFLENKHNYEALCDIAQRSANYHDTMITLISQDETESSEEYIHPQ